MARLRESIFAGPETRPTQQTDSPLAFRRSFLGEVGKGSEVYLRWHQKKQIPVDGSRYAPAFFLEVIGIYQAANRHALRLFESWVGILRQAQHRRSSYISLATDNRSPEGCLPW
ncbi:MAG: hypothetical protein AAF399_10860 [Bacteroidota bacterium]